MTPPTPRSSRRRAPPDCRAERAAVLAALHPIVDMLGSIVGPHIEIVLHDLTRPAQSVLAIANGHVSGRGVGASILAGPKDDVAFAAAVHALAPGGAAQHAVVKDYPTVTAAGRPLKSATTVFRDAAGEPFAALCLNADLSAFEFAHAWLERLLRPVAPRAAQAPQARSARQPDMDALLQEIIDDAVRTFGKPVAMMNRDEKIHAVKAMLERGLFIVKGGVEHAAAALGVTRYTVYNYLQALRK